MKIIPAAFIAVLVLAVAVVVATPPATTADQLLEQYFLIHKSLASDVTSGVSVAAAQIEKIGRRAGATEPQARTQLNALSDAAAKLQAIDLKSTRSGFGELSDRLIAYLKASKAKRNPPYQFFCSMVKKNWLQPDKQIRNPYYGKSMLECGELVAPE